jgi:anthranilate phosphoribosyltransferase
VLQQLNEQLEERQDLTDKQVTLAVGELVEASASDELKADFLSALSQKGETVAEISAFARELRARALVPPIDAKTRAETILDVCGTGGDRLNTFNISTTVALVCAAAGVAVAKHGNRAITSQAGSADVLQALGIKIELSPEEAARSLREHRFAFFFAPYYHPAFRHIGGARKLCANRGQRGVQFSRAAAESGAAGHATGGSSQPGLVPDAGAGAAGAGSAARDGGERPRGREMAG